MRKSRREGFWRCHRILIAATAAASLSVASTTGIARAEVLVFAASSTIGAIEDLVQAYSARGLGDARVAFAGSSTLARQIAAGAPADIYISANPQWMDYLATGNALAPGTRRDLVGNQLVVVAPSANPFDVRLEADFPLVEAMNGKPLAMGDPDHVPAGMYAKAALKKLGLWETLAPHIAPMHHVRAALALVERGEAAAGIVYATDAAASTRVSVVAAFPSNSHPPILFPAAIVAGHDRPEVRRFFAFLTSAEAKTVFVAYGFSGVPLTSR
jgi:molybdate transport system substrate-binding protein